MLTIKEFEQRLRDMERLTPYVTSSNIKLRFVVGDYVVDVESFRNPEGSVVFDVYSPENGYEWQLNLREVLAAVKKNISG